MVKAIMDQLWDRKGAMPPADMRLLLLPEQQATFDERIAEELLFYNNPPVEDSTEESEGEGPQGGGTAGSFATAVSGSGSTAPPPPPPPQPADAATVVAGVADEAAEADVQEAPITPPVNVAATAVRS